MSVEAESAETSYSPFHMVASGLGTCTYSVLASWAANAKLRFDDLAIEVSWSFADEPHRASSYGVHIRWPSLPDTRRAAAGRAATLCAVHSTLTHHPEIAIEVAS